MKLFLFKLILKMPNKDKLLSEYMKDFKFLEDEEENHKIFKEIK